MSFVDSLLDISLIVMPVAGYIPQYLSMRKTRSVEGFSPLVSFILLIANMLRIFFWIDKQFDSVLLYQSFVMIAAQIILLELIVRIKAYRDGIPLRPYRPNVYYFKTEEFWNWKQFDEYLAFLSVFVLIGGSLTLFNHFILQSSLMTEFIGYFAVLVESCLGIPQLIKNFNSRSVKGLSFVLIFSWFAGDFYKTLLFLYKSSPMQFVVCGMLQIIVDVLILLQMMIYKS